MKYEFVINKTQVTQEEDFERAMIAAKGSMESILYDYDGVRVEFRQSNIIEISTRTEEESLPFTIDECLMLITPAFLNVNLKLYPEFLSIKNI